MLLSSRRVPVLLATLLVFFLMALPHAARADGTSQFNGPGCAQNTQQALMARAQARTQAFQNVAMNAPRINLKNMYGLNCILTTFSFIASLSDPLGLFTSLIASLIQTLMQDVCQAIQGVISQITSFAASLGNLLCLPMPSLPGLGMGGINLGLHPITCNGVSLLNLSPIPSGNIAIPSPILFFGTRPGTGSQVGQ